MFALDAKTGEPKRLQHISTHGVEALTISVAPGNQWLIVGNQKDGQVQRGPVTERSAPTSQYSASSPTESWRFTASTTCPKLVSR
ncbi:MULTISPECIES: hypothetical protein [Pseudomonas]|uniref:hypothetical protein n=1 Tax=Pseudomonas TaxID=286 RepID=UPI0008FB3C0A|nr:hypothetical protein [Pseudomonas putida]MBC9053114.1 hypothetical protein [Pseudomonas aeruginosa]MBW6313760.1 lactonase family protein [Pseudomonas aeruginosa]NPY70915.1 hypothetical protein [Pseudomonas aeruginosa]QQE82262.1 hypothetical protein JET17_16630 [Pseudomonas putida]